MLASVLSVVPEGAIPPATRKFPSEVGISVAKAAFPSGLSDPMTLFPISISSLAHDSSFSPVMKIEGASFENSGTTTAGL